MARISYRFCKAQGSGSFPEALLFKKKTLRTHPDSGLKKKQRYVTSLHESTIVKMLRMMLRMKKKNRATRREAPRLQRSVLLRFREQLPRLDPKVGNRAFAFALGGAIPARGSGSELLELGGPVPRLRKPPT